MMLHIVVLVVLVGMVSADFDPELHAKHLTLSRSAFIEHFNAQNYSWKITHYGDIQAKYPPCAHIDYESIKKLPLQIHDLKGIDLPESFDARDQWPKCETIAEIYDQGQCGSCWTFGVGMTASDRSCIHKDIHVRLSQQDFECSQLNVCGGGYPDKAFEFWKEHGVVTQECKPYNITELKQNKCVEECKDTNIDYKQDKHYAESVYKISNDTNQIKAELVKNGPIQAAFKVFGDFFDYESGVYEHKYGYMLGGHSVRLIGYGVEEGLDYWLVANSWGDWGDHGLFKIKICEKASMFEQYMYSGKPKK